MSARIVLMTKVPVAGQVKTRLRPVLSPMGAVALHRAMIFDTLSLVKAAGLPCTVSVAGEMDHPVVADLRALGLDVEAQFGADLGERLVHALRGAKRAVAIGADCVCFDPDWLREAAEAEAPVSLGPAEDGGYWLIAVDPSARVVVFEDIPWSTDKVHQQTLARAVSAGLEVHQVPQCYDIDRPEDLARLFRDPRCPAQTRAVLESLRT